MCLLGVLPQDCSEYSQVLKTVLDDFLPCPDVEDGDEDDDIDSMEDDE